MLDAYSRVLLKAYYQTGENEERSSTPTLEDPKGLRDKRKKEKNQFLKFEFCQQGQYHASGPLDLFRELLKDKVTTDIQTYSLIVSNPNRSDCFCFVTWSEDNLLSSSFFTGVTSSSPKLKVSVKDFAMLFVNLFL